MAGSKEQNRGMKLRKEHKMKGLIGLALIALGGLIGILCFEPVEISLLLGVVLMAVGVLLVILEILGERTISFQIEDIKNPRKGGSYEDS